MLDWLEAIVWSLNSLVPGMVRQLRPGLSREEESVSLFSCSAPRTLFYLRTVLALFRLRGLNGSASESLKSKANHSGNDQKERGWFWNTRRYRRNRHIVQAQVVCDVRYCELNSG